MLTNSDFCLVLVSIGKDEISTWVISDIEGNFFRLKKEKPSGRLVISFLGYEKTNRENTERDGLKTQKVFSWTWRALPRSVIIRRPEGWWQSKIFRYPERLLSHRKTFKEHFHSIREGSRFIQEVFNCFLCSGVARRGYRRHLSRGGSLADQKPLNSDWMVAPCY